MFAQIRASIVVFVALTLLTGIVYPLAVTGIAQAAFAHQANGSVMVKNGNAIGSTLIGQAFDDPKYFWGRLSATLDANGKALPYNASASSASNLGPTNSALVDEVKARIDALQAADPENRAAVPVDLVTSSASGLDPDISPAAAEYQLQRVARLRHFDEARVRSLVEEHTASRQFGIFGEARVNVLELNLALDALL